MALAQNHKCRKIQGQPTLQPFDEPDIKPPLLETGDRLTRAEFERRYHAMPHVKKAELIEGVVYMPSPVRHKGHGEPHSHIILWLGTYCVATPGVNISDNATIRLDFDNEVQPDALLQIEPAAGGNSRISDDDYIEGVPELVVEIAASSAAYDMYDKFEVYLKNGVQEYIVWQTHDNVLYWLRFVDGESVTLMPDAHGIVRSRVFPSLSLAVSALIRGDMATVLAELHNGLGDAEHSAFVHHLAT